MQLLVENLSHVVTEAELRELFQPFGTLQSISLITDPQTQKTTGSALGEFADRGAARLAVAALNGKPFNVRHLKVELASKDAAKKVVETARRLKRRLHPPPSKRARAAILAAWSTARRQREARKAEEARWGGNVKKRSETAQLVEALQGMAEATDKLKAENLKANQLSIKPKTEDRPLSVGSIVRNAIGLGAVFLGTLALLSKPKNEGLNRNDPKL